MPGKVVTMLLNYSSFENDDLVNYTQPHMKTYKYYNRETKRINEIQFSDYKKWYRKNKAVWNSDAYGNAQFKLQYFDENNARLSIRRRYQIVNEPNLLLILERKNKIYTKNGDRINELTDWIYYFYQPANNWKGSQDLRNYPAFY